MTSQSADLIAEAEAAAQMWTKVRNWDHADLMDRVVTALRASEGREQKLREALMEIAAGSPFVRWMDDNPLSGIKSETFSGMEDGYFIASEAARRALGGEP